MSVLIISPFQTSKQIISNCGPLAENYNHTLFSCEMMPDTQGSSLKILSYAKNYIPSENEITVGMASKKVASYDYIIAMYPDTIDVNKAMLKRHNVSVDEYYWSYDANIAVNTTKDLLKVLKKYFNEREGK